MSNPLRRYMQWLHLQWPAGTVEKMPLVHDDGSTNVPGVYVVGDLAGIPLLKFSADTGTRVVRTIASSASFKNRDGQAIDVAIVGGGVSGFAAALEAKKMGLSFTLFEASEPFSTIVNFPKGKPIYTYPTDMTPAGDLKFHAKSNVKEGLLDDLREQTIDAGITAVPLRVESVRRVGKVIHVRTADGKTTCAHSAVIAIGRSGNYRKLAIPGENKNKVYNRLHDPMACCDQNVLVVGGGDSALEAATTLADCGARVTISYRKPQFARPKPDNLEKIDAAASVQRMMASSPKEIRDGEVVITDSEGNDRTLPNDAVFTMIGREPPLDFFRRSGIPIRGEWRAMTYVSFALVLLACVFVYHWKKGGVWLPINEAFADHGWFPFNVPQWWASLGGAFADPSTILGTMKVSLGEPGFYYSLAYCLCVVLFGFKRIRRRKTPYIKVQTLTLMAIQVIPLFLLPYIILPWLGNNGVFSSGVMKTVADALFPEVNYGHGREYWRAFGFILAWPLFFYNVFAREPLWTWLIISLVQTFVIIPLLVYRFGKGAYCSWICSCGALAETLGDSHRHKMPHGPLWNRLNMIGQVFLALAFILLFTRSLSWVWPDSVFGSAFDAIYHGLPALNYVWFVDLLWAGIIGVGCYWHFSGRVWCRFACPLAALMNIYARFSRFRILADKKKCISCNICTSVCHQGIDIMNFANKGLPMEDPQCVRCSACVGACPTGVLTFGQIDRATGEVIATDTLGASPVQMAELTVGGRALNSG